MNKQLQRLVLAFGLLAGLVVVQSGCTSCGSRAPALLKPPAFLTPQRTMQFRPVLPTIPQVNQMPAFPPVRLLPPRVGPRTDLSRSDPFQVPHLTLPQPPPLGLGQGLGQPGGLGFAGTSC